MKLTKSILKEIIREVILEADIMDKEIKNPKTGNMIKVKTALQLPDEHPANKKAKKMLAKSGEVGGPSYPNVPKKKPKEKPKGISMFDPLSGKEYEPRDEPKPELNRDEANEDAVKSAEKIADKYGINNDQSHNDQGLSHTSIGAGGEYDGDNQITVAADEYEDGSIKYGIAVNDEDAMQGPFTFKNFNTKKEMESALDKLLSDKKIQKALKAGTNLRDVKDRVDSIMGTKGEYQNESITSKLKKEFKQYDNINKNLTRG
jgi:hypothetical protein